MPSPFFLTVLKKYVHRRISERPDLIATAAAAANQRQRESFEIRVTARWACPPPGGRLTPPGRARLASPKNQHEPGAAVPGCRLVRARRAAAIDRQPSCGSAVDPQGLCRARVHLCARPARRAPLPEHGASSGDRGCRTRAAARDAAGKRSACWCGPWPSRRALKPTARGSRGQARERPPAPAPDFSPWPNCAKDAVARAIDDSLELEASVPSNQHVGGGADSHLIRFNAVWRSGAHTSNVYVPLRSRCHPSRRRGSPVPAMSRFTTLPTTCCVSCAMPRRSSGHLRSGGWRPQDPVI